MADTSETEYRLSDDLRAALARPLTYGAHHDLAQGCCLLEVHDAWRQIAALAAHAPQRVITLDDVRAVSDDPSDVAAPLRRFGIGLNDKLLDTRTPYTRLDLEPRLRACQPLLAGTAEALESQQRRWSLLALDWLTREHLVAWLRLTPALAAHADALAALPDLTIPDTDFAAIGAQVRAVANVVSDVAWAAARAADGVTTWAAARAAAGNAVGASAGNAAKDTVVAAVGAAAGNVARAAAGVTVVVAAREAAVDAAWSAAQTQLASTVRRLQASALSLFERMLGEDW